MGWETVKGIRYFCETTYVDGERFRHCWGSGPEAEAAALRIASERAAEAKDRNDLRVFILRDKNMDRLINDSDTAITITIRDCLAGTGYHDARHPWR